MNLSQLIVFSDKKIKILSRSLSFSTLQFVDVCFYVSLKHYKPFHCVLLFVYCLFVVRKILVGYIFGKKYVFIFFLFCLIKKSKESNSLCLSHKHTKKKKTTKRRLNILIILSFVAENSFGNTVTIEKGRLTFRF